MNRRDLIKAIGGIPVVGMLLSSAPAFAEEGWIPVGDRLPEIDEWVMLFVYRGTWISGGKSHGKHCICVGRYNGIRHQPWQERDFPHWSSFGPDSYGSDVTHWRPLPEPPLRMEDD